MLTARMTTRARRMMTSSKEDNRWLRSSSSKTMRTMIMISDLIVKKQTMPGGEH